MNISKTYVIRTVNLTLRIPNESDIPHVFLASRYQGFNDGMMWDPPKHISEISDSLENIMQEWKSHKAYCFTIEHILSHKFLGRISIRKTSIENQWNVGFWTHPEEQGKGIMTEALKAMLHFGFTELKASIIEACYATWNKASEKVLIKNGMKFDHFIEKGFLKKGKWVEENLYVIKYEDWKNRVD